MNDKKGRSSSWCLVSVGDDRVKAKINHVGRGKFKILEIIRVADIQIFRLTHPMYSIGVDI
jgi:hypothetical protein